MTAHPFFKLSSLLCLALLSACQTTQPLQQAQTVHHSATAPRLEGQQRQGALYLSPSAKIKIEPQAGSEQNAQITLQITMPNVEHDDFGIQRLAANNISKIKAQLQGIGMVAPIYANGADGNGMLSNPGGSFSISFSNVPYGAVRYITLECYDNTSSLIAGATVKSVFAVNAASGSVELSFKTTPTAEVLQAISGSAANDHLAANLNLSSLQSFINTLTGVSGTLPNYSYTTHPSLIVGSAIAADLVSNSGNIALLNSSNAAYKIQPGTVTYTLAGLINPDQASVVVRDPASGEVLGQSNGNSSVTGVKPGTWKVEATAPGYTADSSPMVTVPANGSVSAGTINFSISTAPVISSLNVSNGIIGSSLTINGSNFHSTIAGNTVDFDGTVATISSASSTQLQVTVPGGIYGSKNVRVTVGGQPSNSSAFAVKPNLTSLNVSSGIIGSSVTLTGTGFSPTENQNNVNLSGSSANVTSASNTQLVVEVPTAASGNITIQVGTQTSNGLSFNVLPTVSLTSPGTGLTNGTIPVSASVTSGNNVSKVEFFRGGTKIGEDTNAPYSIDWDTTTAPSGAHTLTAKVTDSQSNTATSSGVNITLDQYPVISTLSSSLNPLPGLGHSTLLTCNASDSEDTPTISWSTVGGTFGSFSTTTGSQVYWTAPASAGGPYTLRCSVDDGVNEPVTQDLVQSVVSNTGNINGNGGLY